MNNITTLEQVQERVLTLSKDCRDEFVPVKDIHFDHLKSLRIGSERNHSLKPVAQREIANRLGVPLNYLKKCPTDLQATNLNHWIGQEKHENLFFRFDGDQIRAIFTPAYKPVDNKEVLAQLLTMGYPLQTKVQLSLDEEFMLLNIPDEEQEFSIGNRDRLQPGISIANSEVGTSRFNVSVFVLRLICTNGLIAHTPVSSSYRHVSERILEEFPSIVARLQQEQNHQSRQWKISLDTPVDDPPATMESFNRRFHLDPRQSEAVLEWAWPQEQGSAMFHIINSYTKASQHPQLSAEQSYGLQQTGGRILALLN